MMSGYDFYKCIYSIINMINNEGIVSADIKDVKSVLYRPGMFISGEGCASGERRAYCSAIYAIHDIMVKNIPIYSVGSILVIITVDSDLNMSMIDFSDVGNLIRDYFNIYNIKNDLCEPEMIIACSNDESLHDTMKINILLGGINVDANSSI